MMAMAALLLAGSASAQERLSDKDVEKLLGNLKEDASKFSDTFKHDLSKSTIRKTSEEKAAKQAAERFPKQVDGMLKQFRSKKKADTTLPVVYQSYRQLEQFMSRISPAEKTMQSWTRIRQEIELITKAFNFTPPA